MKCDAPVTSPYTVRLLLAASCTLLVACREAASPNAPATVGGSSSQSGELAAPTTAQSPPSGPAAVDEAPTIRDDDWFEDVTHQSGVDFSYRNGQQGNNFFILESLGGGGALLDYDLDGNLDLFIAGGGTISEPPVAISGLPSALYRNIGDWQFVDTTLQAGLVDPGDYSHGCAVGDFDGDGWPDLVLCCYGSCRLYRNTGDGHFRDVTQASGFVVDGWNTAAVWADVDRDGLPDLYVVRYLEWTPETALVCRNRRGHREICSPGRYQGADDRLFRNRGDGTLEDITTLAGIESAGNGLGVVAADFNSDNWIDLYVANDETNNRLYLGQPDSMFAETGMPAGVATNQYGMHDGSMGIDLGDYDDDGDADLWTTNFETEDNGLYQNLGDATFASATTVAGLAGHSRRQVGFGTGLADFDFDGRLDIYVVNGHVFYAGGQAPYLQRAQLFRNSDGKRFENTSHSGGIYFRESHAARGAAVDDLDNDGALDLVIVHQNAPVTLLKNRRRPQHHLCLRLVGIQSEPLAVGAVVVAEFEGRQLTRFVRGGAGYFSHSDQRILLPAVDENSIRVTVSWPSGLREVFPRVEPNQTQTLIEGRGEPAAS